MNRARNPASSKRVLQPCDPGSDAAQILSRMVSTSLNLGPSSFSYLNRFSTSGLETILTVEHLARARVKLDRNRLHDEGHVGRILHPEIDDDDGSLRIQRERART